MYILFTCWVIFYALAVVCCCCQMVYKLFAKVISRWQKMPLTRNEQFTTSKKGHSFISIFSYLLLICPHVSTRVSWDVLILLSGFRVRSLFSYWWQNVQQASFNWSLNNLLLRIVGQTLATKIAKIHPKYTSFVPKMTICLIINMSFLKRKFFLMLFEMIVSYNILLTLITFSNSLDPDQTQQNVWPNSWMQTIWYLVNFEKIIRWQKNPATLPNVRLREERIFLIYNSISQQTFMLWVLNSACWVISRVFFVCWFIWKLTFSKI